MKQKWNYNQKADITIGEEKVNKVPKVILIILFSVLILSSSLGYIYRKEIYDYIVDPQASLLYDKIELNIGEKLDLNAAVIQNERAKIELPNNIDSSKPGEYQLVYKSKNLIREKELVLDVIVKDKQNPTITLVKDIVLLTREVDTQTFDVKAQVQEAKDNYSEVEVIYPEAPDFSKDEIELVYTVKDKAGNESQAIQKLIISNKPEVKEVIKEVQVQVPVPTQPSQPQVSAPVVRQEVVQPAAPRNPYISGVRNHTFKVGTSFSIISSELSSGVRGSGTINVDFSNVNITVPGSYNVYFNGSDGARATSVVTIIE